MLKTSSIVRLAAFAGLVAAPLAASAGSVFFSASYSPSVSFADALSGTTMTIAFDGSSYWSASGGSASGTRLARYDASGAFIAGYQPGQDFRSVFSDSANNVLARSYSDSTIYQQSSPGTFSAVLSLTGGNLNEQSSVVKDGSRYVAMINGTVSQWDASGTIISDVNLTGYGSVGSEGNYPANRGIAVAGAYWLTYADGTLSAWDHSGTRVDSATLAGAGVSFDSNFSLSFANNKVFVVTEAGATWNGYDVGISAVPEPETYALMLAGLGALSLLTRRRKSI